MKKKWVSILLSAAMAMTVVSPSFAENAVTLESQSDEQSMEDPNSVKSEEDSLDQESERQTNEEEVSQEERQELSEGTGQESGDFTYTISNNKITITGYTGTATEVKIPEQIDGEAVTSINDRVFYNNTVLEKVTIPFGITYIGNEAFRGCVNLREVVYNCELNDLGKDIFMECPQLTNLYIGPQVETLYQNGNGTMFGEYLESYEVDAKNERLVSIDGVIYSKGDNGKNFMLYRYPINRKEEVYILSSETMEISENAFLGVKNLKELTITGNGISVWYHDIQNIPNLEKLNLEKNIEYFSDSSVYNCPKLSVVVQKANITRGYTDCFEKCDQIKEMIIGENVTKFLNVVDGKVELYTVEKGNLNYKAENGVLYEGTTLLAYPVKKTDTEYTIKDGTTVIDKAAFCGVSNLESIEFCSSITEIKDDAFEDCTNLREIDLSKLKKYSLGDSVFSGCTSINEIKFGKGLSELGDSIFYDCNNIREVVIEPENRLKIPMLTFDSMSSLEKVVLGGEINKISNNAFSYLPSLNTVEFGENISEINECGLNDCKSLKAIIVDENNNYYCAEEGVLFSKDKKQLIIYPAAKSDSQYGVPDEVEVIKKNAFANNSYLESVKIGKRVTEIEESAFRDCKYLNIIEIPENVMTIGRWAIEKGTIRGVKGSAAEEYAINNDLVFVDINMTTEPEGQGTPDYGSSIWDGASVEEIEPIGETYIVENAAQLAWISEAVEEGVSFRGKTVILAADIDLDNNVWSPIGTKSHPFEGNFDGQNHSINNFNIENDSHLGIFGYISSKVAGDELVIKNLTITGGQIKEAKEDGGLLAGRVKVTEGADFNVENCLVAGTVNGATIGGLIGIIEGGYANSEVIIENCSSDTDLTTGGRGGGVVGIVIQNGAEEVSEVNGTVIIRECDYSGKLTGTGRYGTFGGILCSVDNAKRGYLKIQRCVSDGNINSSNYVSSGGIISSLSGEHNQVAQCVNYANVNGGYYVGGIVGNSSNAIIEECYNEGYIQGTVSGCSFGGITGANGGIIKNCYNAGLIGGSNFAYMGGMTGSNGGIIENSYDVGGMPGYGNTSVSVSFPGAMASIVGGTTKYCFYDKSFSENAYLYGTLKTQEIINDESQNITHSGGLTTSEMKNQSSYVNWDFMNVWGFDKDYGYGYPILIGVKDLLRQHPDESDREEKETFRITVVDQDDQELENVSVTCGENVKTTNERGIVSFEFVEEIVGLTASKEGYVTYTDKSFSMNSTREYKIRLIASDKLQENPLNSAVLDVNNHRYELMTQTKTISRRLQGLNMKLICTPAVDKNTVKKYEICQGETVVADSDDGKFTLEPEMFEKSKNNGIFTDTVVRIYTDQNECLEACINLTITDEDSVESSMVLGDNLKFTVDDDVPGLGGTEINLLTFKVPVITTISDEKWKVAVNLVDGDGKSDEILKSEDTLGNKLDKLKDYMKTGTFKLTDNPNISMEIVGYAEGDLPMSSNKIKLQLYVRVAAEYGWEVQVPSTPVVFALEIGGELQADGTIELNMDEIDVQGKVKASGKIGITGFVGAGVAYVASTGLYGKGEANMSVYVLPKELSGLNELYLALEFKAGIRFAGSEVVTWPVAGPYYGFVYSRSRDEYEAESIQGLEEKEKLRLEEISSMKAEKSTEEPAGKWTGTEAVLQQKAYSESRPVMMYSGGDVVMIFTSNTAEDRPLEDASILMYSVYDNDSKEWSEPKPVADDKTADFNPCADGDYVVWNNAKSSLESCSTYTELGMKQEVSIAKYNSRTHSFEEAETLTNNDVYENALKLTIVNGEPIVSWETNSEKDIFGCNGINTFYTAVRNGKTWEISEVSQAQHMVLNSAAGVIDGRQCYAYVVDEDNDPANSIGQRAYLTFADNHETISLTQENVSYIQILDGQNKVIWLGQDGNIYSKSGAGGETQQETTAGKVNGTVKQVLETGNGNLILLFVNHGENCSNVYRMSYDAEQGAWSDPIALTEGTDYVENISGIMVNGNFLYAYNQRQVDADSDDLNGINSLRYASLNAETITVSDVQVKYSENQVGPSQVLPLTLSFKNEGMVVCKKVHVKITDESKKNYFDQDVDVSVLPGNTAETTVNITLPSDLKKQDYKIELKSVDPAETDTVNTSVTIGNSNMKIERSLYKIGDKVSLTVSVINEGYDNGTGRIEVYDYDDPEVIYDIYDVRSLAPGSTSYFTTKLDKLNWDSFQVKTLGIRFTSGGKQVGDSRTVTLYQDKKLSIESLSINKLRTQLKKIGDTEKLQAVIKPSEAVDVDLIWESSNPQIVSVKQDGVVQAIQPGSAIISVRTADSKLYGRCEVTVDSEKTSIETVEVSGVKTAYKYTGMEICPKPELRNGDMLLQEGADYTIEYRNNKEVGNATMIITGKGNYEGTLTIEFAIESDEIEPDKFPFVDVTENDWFYNEVKYAYETGIMTGLNDTTFGPGESLARAQFAVIMYRMEGSQPIEYKPVFPDVTEGIWYADAVLWANSVGIVGGYSNGYFGPSDKINREQMAVMMYRYANMKRYDTTQRADLSKYVDADYVNSFSKDAMQWCVSQGIISGKDNGTRLDPQGNASRAECATIMKRFIEKYK